MDKVDEVVLDLIDFFREQVDGDDPVEIVTQFEGYDFTRLLIDFESGAAVAVTVEDA